MDAQKILILTLFLALARPAFADISFAQNIKVDAAGGMSMFGSESDVLTQLSGDKWRTESTMKMKSKLMGMFAGDGTTANIVRLDKQLSWHLLPEKQQYSEVTFAQSREQIAEAQRAMQDAQASGNGALPVSAEGCQWTDGEVEVEHPGGTEKVAGIKTRQHIVRMSQTCTDPNTRKTCDVTWLLETWMAKKVPAEKEVRSFRNRFATAMDFDDVQRHMDGHGQGLLAMFANNWDEVVDEFEKIEGYPLRTVMQMGIGGEQCTTASGQPIALDQMWGDASTAAYNAALGQAGYQAGGAVARAAGETLGGSVAGSIGGAAVGAAAGELIGGLTGMFKKEKPSATKPPPQADAANKQVTVFRIATEVTSWSEIRIPPERFAEPVSWKKL